MVDWMVPLLCVTAQKLSTRGLSSHSRLNPRRTVVVVVVVVAVVVVDVVVIVVVIVVAVVVVLFVIVVVVACGCCGGLLLLLGCYCLYRYRTSTYGMNSWTVTR